MVLVRFQHQPLPRQLTPMHTHTPSGGSDATSNRLSVLPLVSVSQRRQTTVAVLLALTCCHSQPLRSHATATTPQSDICRFLRHQRQRSRAARNRSAELVPSRIRTLFVVGSLLLSLVAAPFARFVSSSRFTRFYVLR